MKAILATSMTCSAVSLLGLVGLSAMSVAPEVEDLRCGMMLAAGVFGVAWLLLALWAGGRLQASGGAAATPPRLRAVVVLVGVVYILLVLLCSVG